MTKTLNIGLNNLVLVVLLTEALRA